MFQQLKQLPANPNLRQLRIQAKELLKAYRSGDPEALSRIRESHPRYPNASESEIRGAALLLSDIQLVIAHEYGFPSWPQLKRHLELGRTIRTARDAGVWSWGEDAVGYYEDRTRELLKHHQAGLKSAVRRLREHHPQFSKTSDEEIRSANLSVEDARLVIAKEFRYGIQGNTPHRRGKTSSRLQVLDGG